MKTIIDMYKSFSFILLLSFNLYAPNLFGQVGSKAIDEDNVIHKWPGGKHGFKASNRAKAGGDITFQLATLVPYISYCKRFPENLQDAYRPIDNAPEGCRILKSQSEYLPTPWIDPWGRPYQVRYNKERMKIQMRSQGRNLEDLSDDIVRENNLSIKKEVYDSEIAKCNKLPKEDKKCAFNRDWH